MRPDRHDRSAPGRIGRGNLMQGCRDIPRQSSGEKILYHKDRPPRQRNPRSLEVGRKRQDYGVIYRGADGPNPLVPVERACGRRRHGLPPSETEVILVLVGSCRHPNARAADSTSARSRRAASRFLLPLDNVTG